MTGAFTPRYTEAQRDAIAHAYEDRRIRPASKVAALAAAGELEHQGQQLEPFTVPENTVRDFARILRKRRRGELTSELANQPHRDAIETLRQRYVSLADQELAYEERQPAGSRDPERLRQIGRLLREAAALPARDDPAPRAPGSKAGTGKQTEAPTRGGLAGAILADHHRSTGEEPAPSAPDPQSEDGDQHATGNGASSDTHDNGEHDRSNDVPGSRVRELATRVGVGDASGDRDASVVSSSAGQAGGLA